MLLNCHAGCSTEDICAALGLTVKDLFMEDKTKERSRERPQIVEIYPYHHDLQKSGIRTNHFYGGGQMEKADGYGTGRVYQMPSFKREN